MKTPALRIVSVSLTCLLLLTTLSPIAAQTPPAHTGPPEPAPNAPLDIRTKLQPYQASDGQPSQPDGRVLEEASLLMPAAEERPAEVLGQQTLYSIADAVVLQGYASANLGDTVDMWAGYDEYLSPDGRICRSLVRFNISSIPSGQQITEATLRLRLGWSWDYPDRSRTIRTYRASSGWSEGTVTWNNKPGYAESYGSRSIVHGAWGWYEFDVTNLVSAWYEGTYANYGIMVRGPEVSGSDASWRGFYTRESSYTPELVVSYTSSAVPDIAVSPASFDISLQAGQSAQRTMTIANTGTGTLTYSISDVETTTSTARRVGSTLTGEPSADRIGEERTADADGNLVDFAGWDGDALRAGQPAVMSLDVLHYGPDTEPPRFSALGASVTRITNPGVISEAYLNQFDVFHIGYAAERDYGSLASKAAAIQSYIFSGGGVILEQPGESGYQCQFLPTGFGLTVDDSTWPGYPTVFDPLEFTSAGHSHPMLQGLTPSDMSANFDTVYDSDIGASYTRLARLVSYPNVIALAVGEYGGGRIVFHTGNVQSMSADPGSDAYVEQMFEWAAGGSGAADAPWLDESPKSGSVPPGAHDNITVSVDTTGLDPGEYSANILVASNDPDENPVTVPVDLEVTQETTFPDIDVSPASLEETLAQGGTTVRTLTIGNTGTDSLTFDIHEVDGGFTPAATEAKSTASDDASQVGSVSIPDALSWIGLLPDSPPEFEAAPMREAAAEAPPAHTGLLQPPMDLSHLTGDRLPEDREPAVLPNEFDWRNRSGTNYVTPVKDQANCGSCYAFGAIGNLESKMLIDGAGTYDFSENNAKECNWRELNNFQYPSPGDYWGSCDGGNAFMMANLFSQKGTVLESCDPYQDSDVACKSTCPYQKTVLDWRLISGGVPSPAVLKQYIYDHGPVITSMYADSSEGFNTYDGSYTINYNTPGDATNHCVLIVGWSRTLPPEPGSGTAAEGWIVKNSWGTGWGASGYFYITYGAANIGSASSFFNDWQDYDSDGDIWYYDEDGWWTSFGQTGGSNTTAWGLAKFTAADDTTVTRVEFWTADETTDVDVYVYDSFDGTTLSGLRTTELNNAFAEPGYHSVALGSPVAVSGGDDVVAVVKITDATYGYPLVGDPNGPTENQRTYISLTGDSGSWTDLGAVLDSDAGIRLRTGEAAVEDVPWLSEAPTSGTVAPGSSQTIDVTFDATGLSAGTYTADIVIDNNDPDEDPVTVPATLHVSPPGDPVIVTIGNGNGSPGSTDNAVAIAADNQSQNTTPIGGAEFWVVYDGSVGLTLADVDTTARSSGFNVDLTLDESTPSAVVAHILLYSGAGATIASGTGPIAELLFDVAASAQPEDSSPLSFSNVLLSDELANPIPNDHTDTGEFTFGCAKDGDINDDRNVNIFDLQILINMILHSPQPDPSLYALDWWCRGDLAPVPSGDGGWNIFDLQVLIQMILGVRESGRGPTLAGRGTNTISIREVHVQPGTTGAFDIDCDNEDTIGAAELWFTYDSTIGVDVSDVSATSRTSGWNVNFAQDDSDPSAVEVHVLLYNTSGGTLDPGTGAILSVAYSAASGASGSSVLDITQVNLGDASDQPLPATAEDRATHIDEG